MARATWKGFLKLSLVVIPIKVYPATESSESLAFNQLHTTCQSRLQQKRWCPTCACDVLSADIVKGFEFEKGKYVLLEPAELDAVAPPSTRVIEVLQFSPAEQLEHRHIDRTYFLESDALNGADEAFRTIQAAMTGRIAVGTLALYGREYLVAIGVLRGVLLLYTLHHEAEWRPLPARPATSDAYLPGVREARQLFSAMTRPLDLTAFPNQYRADLQRIIDAKIAGQEIVEPAPVAATSPLPFNDALLRSLDEVTAKKKTPAKASTAAAKTKAS